MPSLPEHVHRVHEGSLHQVNGLAESGSLHVLDRPFECGDRVWVKCRCGWLCSCDRVIDLPTRCEFEQRAAEFAADTLRTARVSRREWAELNKLLRRSA